MKRNKKRESAKRKKRIHRIGGMLLSVLMLCTCAFPAAPFLAEAAEDASQAAGSKAVEEQTVTEAAGESEHRVVRVAFPEQEGMSFVGHSGKVSGYNYDYLEKISEYTGWKMEYVSYPDKDGTEAVMSAMNDLTEGKVDLLGPLLKNAQTEEMFEFPENSYGTVYTTLCALATSSLRETNLQYQNPLRVGLWKQAETRNSEVTAFLESENLQYEILYYETSEEQLRALER